MGRRNVLKIKGIASAFSFSSISSFADIPASEDKK